jgi:hypothetical protein
LQTGDCRIEKIGLGKASFFVRAAAKEANNPSNTVLAHLFLRDSAKRRLGALGTSPWGPWGEGGVRGKGLACRLRLSFPPLAPVSIPPEIARNRKSLDLFVSIRGLEKLPELQLAD